MNARILIVEDEPKIGRALKEGLEGQGYAVSLSITGEDGFFQLKTRQHDLLLLDIMLPGRSGIEILETLRKEDRKLPVLILTAKDSIEDKVIGLETGADDYLVKPFALPELLARVRSLLRRSQSERAETEFKLEDLSIDFLKRIVKRDGEAIDLTKREYEILEYLARPPRQRAS